MIVVTCSTELERLHSERALAAYVNVQGRRTVPDGMVEPYFAVIVRRSPPQVATSLDTHRVAPHGGLMTYNQVAERLNVSLRTVSRRVAEGRLGTVGRRIRTADVVALEAKS